MLRSKAAGVRGSCGGALLWGQRCCKVLGSGQKGGAGEHAGNWLTAFGSLRQQKSLLARAGGASSFGAWGFRAQVG